jgi:molybdopterin synthase catalytic subunit
MEGKRSVGSESSGRRRKYDLLHSICGMERELSCIRDLSILHLFGSLSGFEKEGLQGRSDKPLKRARDIFPMHEAVPRVHHSTHKESTMDLTAMIEAIRQHPRFEDVGMVLSHSGYVRRLSRNGRQVIGFQVDVDEAKCQAVIEQGLADPGIVDIKLAFNSGKVLKIGDPVMLLVVAGDIRDNVFACLEKTLNRLEEVGAKKKQEFFNEHPEPMS